ncbi:hypothetical protein A2962_02900 [Candidatus Woesebacteria bacterium RIFCSPLOWO2_01_FULL_39_61]|uniref:Uncharacterized protein n=1 Tax=Candidatus Woesebacteria bacterium RIFCSPHIGHO2_02_FULL_39_13 TaxID=1802505 RepID=A0A1F7Z0E6_9BACT|nr:MAG: hypothetical protein A2692_00085 [Candidatus Woesebacteria bacterium RIFCSPHIGHO2_01_FULL_39_95]OGM32428.1 MAG: hypothetical protein A3D01_04615 [Candidatus Woesebacteria bacterium RIFCSPHIGHO2_02_FULL_39_13]OGM67387.1 MAG: hypothetical protein A2962_02900 [Candidatus Woesebacteria bacterium RIFCSPLOWO2_01_FULL_39_61]OGM74484.1 MAG: hypothetical protein A3H19_05545 [Candidatus Woesebacteria bacterium RIFCSPLOWO2_12_FULL_39_9]
MWEAIDSLSDNEKRTLMLWATRSEITEIQNRQDYEKIVWGRELSPDFSQRLSQLDAIQDKLLASNSKTPGLPETV